MTNFDHAIEYILENEGAYVNEPNDPGGATNFGITMAMLAIARKTAVTEDDIKNLTVEDAKQIYKTYFWDKLNLEAIPLSIGTAIFDTAVNQGEGHASLLVQMALCQKNQDGVLGSKTLDQLKFVDSFEFLYAFIGHIQDFYCNIVVKNPKEIVFLKGWIRRSTRLMTLIETA